jgi:methylenetetrahydrofolate reductase (NADPH)
MSVALALEHGPTISFEIFPPRGDGAALDSIIDQLGRLHPDFVAVTYGAGGTRRDGTIKTVERLVATTPWPVVTHLTCVGHTRGEIHELIDRYAEAGTTAVLAVAGDPNGDLPPGDFRYAIELVELIRERSDMEVGVAAFPELHPRSMSRREDRRFLKEKLEAADFAVTQFFFDERDYWRMVDQLGDMGCHKPIVPGVIPVVNPDKVRRFAKMNGTQIPERLFRMMQHSPLAKDEAGRIELAARLAAEQLERLLRHGSPGVHLYTLNRADVVERVIDMAYERVVARTADVPDELMETLNAGHTQRLGVN